MKKTLKRIAAACAAALLLSASVVPALAADTEENSLLGSGVDAYIFSQLKDAIILGNGYVKIPGYGYITEEKFIEMRDAYLEYYLNSILKPTFPPVDSVPNWGIPGFGSTESPAFVEKSITLDQFQSTSLYFGSAYSYASSNEDVVTVNAYGVATAVGEGTATVIVTNGLYTVAIIYVTVNPIDIDTTDLHIRMNVSDDMLEVGETATVWAYLTRYNTYPFQSVLGELELSVSDEAILDLEGNTITAKAVGTAYVTATLKNTDLSESVLITVAKDLETIYPSYPFYPVYPNYPSYPSLPNLPTLPNYPFYPGLGNYYPWYDIEVSVPSFSNDGINWVKLLGIDTDVFEVESKYTFTAGRWMRTFTLVPKDGTEVEEYTTEYRNLYVTGGWQTVAVKTPVDFVPEVEEEVKPEEKPVLTPEEIEALKKAEEEARKQAELKSKIALAMEGKLEWYEVYTDLFGDSYYSAAVAFALENQYVVGNENGTFGAAKEMTFGDVADALCKFLTLTPDELTKAGIIDTKKADELITREEFAVVLQKTAKKMGLKNNGTVDVSVFDDADQLDSDKASAFGWALRNKLLNKNNGKINPEGTVDKARLCQTLYILHNLSK